MELQLIKTNSRLRKKCSHSEVPGASHLQLRRFECFIICELCAKILYVSSVGNKPVYMHTLCTLWESRVAFSPCFHPGSLQCLENPAHLSHLGVYFFNRQFSMPLPSFASRIHKNTCSFQRRAFLFSTRQHLKRKEI